MKHLKIRLNFLTTTLKKELEAKLKKLTGLSFNVKAFPARNKESILIKDDKNIVSKMGPFGATLDNIYVSGDCWFNDDIDEISGSMDFTKFQQERCSVFSRVI